MEENELSWSEKFSLIEEQLKVDPARSDGLIARDLGVVSKASVYRVREVLLADGKIKDVPVFERTAQNGKKARMNGGKDHYNLNGNRINVPYGRTVESLCREALGAEESGMKAEDAAYLVGMGVKSYGEARSIVILSSRSDLSESEAALVHEAMEEMNTTRRTSSPYKRLKHLAERVWGKRNPRNRKSAQKRSASFSHAMTIVMDACMAAPDIRVPLLSKEEKVTAGKQIGEAITSLRKLKRKIVTGGMNESGI